MWWLILYYVISFTLLFIIGYFDFDRDCPLFISLAIMWPMILPVMFIGLLFSLPLMYGNYLHYKKQKHIKEQYNNFLEYFKDNLLE